jgi:hypothetical protein
VSARRPCGGRRPVDRQPLRPDPGTARRKHRQPVQRGERLTHRGRDDHTARGGHAQQEPAPSDAVPRPGQHRTPRLVPFVRGVDEQRADQHVRGPVVGGGEEEGERVPVGDVQHAGHELQQRPADQHERKQPPRPVRDRPDRRPLPQLGVDRPQLGQQQRHRRQPADHVHALGDLVQVHRSRRPLRPARRMLHEVADQPRHERRREADTEGHAQPRRHPLVMQAAAEPAGQPAHGLPVDHTPDATDREEHRPLRTGDGTPLRAGAHLPVLFGEPGGGVVAGDRAGDDA